MTTIKFRTVSMAILLSPFLIFGCHAGRLTANGLLEARKEIALKNELYFHSLAKGDSLLFASCYTEDCWIMPSNAATLCGARAPFDFFKTVFMNQGIRKGQFISIDLFGEDGECLTEVGFRRTVTIDNEKDNGKFIVIWKKTPEGWKRFRDSFSSYH